MRRYGWLLLWVGSAVWSGSVLAQSADPADVPHGAAAGESQHEIAWIEGPDEVDVGVDLATLALPEGFAFAGPADARFILSQMGNQTHGGEMGLVVPTDESQQWFIVFEWNGVGYVKDEEKDTLDPDAIFKSLKAADEEGNVWRRENGFPTMTLTHWFEAPHYDPETNHLVWATHYDVEDGSKTVNYNVRMLARRGLMSVTLVEEPHLLEPAMPGARRIFEGLTFKTGSRYAEWKPGDKVATYGLTALVAAGAGAAAVKLGFFGVLMKFLGKAWKVVAVAVLGLAGAIGKFFRGLTGRRAEIPTGHDEEPPSA
ncbi:MAG TPA: DUF2167 domain-containing protein [Myxococcaceae bacterium]|nr:DUF2167 domain-containing protein [Myxococcaceae bacterium]